MRRTNRLNFSLFRGAATFHGFFHFLAPFFFIFFIPHRWFLHLYYDRKRALQSRLSFWHTKKREISPPPSVMIPHNIVRFSFLFGKYRIERCVRVRRVDRQRFVDRDRPVETHRYRSTRDTFSTRLSIARNSIHRKRRNRQSFRLVDSLCTKVRSKRRRSLTLN